jgi:hypothetical protein
VEVGTIRAARRLVFEAGPEICGNLATAAPDAAIDANAIPGWAFSHRDRPTISIAECLTPSSI